MSQRDILLSLIQGIEGKAWAEQRQGWTTDDSEVCRWDGVECDETDQETVVGIDLKNQHFIGTIPPELGKLVTLEYVKLSQNLIEGSIPTEFANLPHLEDLQLGQNLLTGYLPVFASRMLKTLNLANNKLFGYLPANIGDRHARLEFVDLTGNSFHGEIPDSISSMTKLKTFAISDNEFSGTIPTALGETSLNYLYMDNNNFVGIIPHEILESGSELMEVWLQHNYLSGTIPAGIASIQYLYDFYIDGNKFTGTIPSDMCRENINKDFFENAGDEVDHDYCDAVSCAVGEYSFDGIYPCLPCDADTTSPYLGRVGKCIENDQLKILQAIFTNTKGELWSGKAMKGWGDDTSTDFCKWTGVTCDSNNNVMKLDLSGMNLQGKLPDEIGFLKYLSGLDVSDNSLYGVIPSDLRWAPISKLDVSGNQLGGVVPPMLCLKNDINKNGNGDISCDHIACAVGSYSETGYALKAGDCRKCKSARFLASKVCEEGEAEFSTPPWLKSPRSSYSNASDDDLTGGQIAGIFFGVLFLALGMFMGTVYFMKKNKENGGTTFSKNKEETQRMNVMNPDVEFT